MYTVHALKGKQVDTSVRLNEKCVIGLPRCGFSFSSARTCFIGYPFGHGNLEVNILKGILEKRGIIPIEAAAQLTPAQNAFCAKICSQVITSQFCIILLNNEPYQDREIPNANVNMEYGLMLGFNKYVIPFQRESQKLPFNVAGLDTVKYTNEDFERKAIAAIEAAIAKTIPATGDSPTTDGNIDAFILTKDAYLSTLDNDGERNLFALGSPLGFNLLNDFSGTRVVYFGNFTRLRAEQVIWRLKTLERLLKGRIASIPIKIKAKLADPHTARIAKDVLTKCPFWVVVTSSDIKKEVVSALKSNPLEHPTQVFSLEDVQADIQKLK